MAPSVLTAAQSPLSGAMPVTHAQLDAPEPIASLMPRRDSARTTALTLAYGNGLLEARLKNDLWQGRGQPTC